MAEVELPAFTPSQKESSDRFVALIQTEIKRSGAMPFSDFMHRSLYEPELGYYVNGFSKFGKHGDFTTAPETSEHFAVCIANQCRQVFDAIGSSDILEFGSGSGRLAVDLLKALANLDCLPLSYLILDVSADLQREQRQLLHSELPANIYRRVQWLQRLPENFTGVVLANEVLDAFAVERFKIVNGSAERVMVGYNDDGFCLLCDYGSDRRNYYTDSKPTGTLRCFYRHTLHNDPFARPAVQDITADVDFTAVTIAATESNMELQGYSPLAEFMLSLDILDHHQNMVESLDARAQIEATGKLKRVIMSQEMGDRFMVIGFSKGIDIALNGFSRADWSRLL